VASACTQVAREELGGGKACDLDQLNSCNGVVEYLGYALWLAQLKCSLVRRTTTVPSIHQWEESGVQEYSEGGGKGF